MDESKATSTLTELLERVAKDKVLVIHDPDPESRLQLYQTLDRTKLCHASVHISTLPSRDNVLFSRGTCSERSRGCFVKNIQYRPGELENNSDELEFGNCVACGTRQWRDCRDDPLPRFPGANAVVIATSPLKIKGRKWKTKAKNRCRASKPYAPSVWWLLTRPTEELCLEEACV